jgi:hypothetical protein
MLPAARCCHPQGSVATVSLPPFQLRQRHAHAQVVPNRFVFACPPAFILAIDANAIQQVALLGRTEDKRLAGKDVARDRGQIFWDQLVQLRGRRQRAIQDTWCVSRQGVNSVVRKKEISSVIQDAVILNSRAIGPNCQIGYVSQFSSNV